MFTTINNTVSCTFISLKWEAKNTYLGIPARRHFYPPPFGRVYPPMESLTPNSLKIIVLDIPPIEQE